jgi:hypothetical protein
MFELANRLVGIYKTHDTTKSVTINPHCFEDAVLSNANPSSAPVSFVAPSSNQAEEDVAEESHSSSPVAKKGRQNKKSETRGEENESLLSQKMSRESDRKMVLGDSTNKY